MDADLSDEEFMLADTQLNFALRMPTLAQDLGNTKLDFDRQHTGTCKRARQAIVTCVNSDHKYIYVFTDAGDRKTLDKFAPVHQAPFGKFAFKGSSKGNSGQVQCWQSRTRPAHKYNCWCHSGTQYG